MPGAHETLEMVFLDIGGVMYDDGVYARSWQRALREMGAEFTDTEFDDEYRAVRAAQAGSFRRHLSARFLPSEPRKRDRSAGISPRGSCLRRSSPRSRRSRPRTGPTRRRRCSRTSVPASGRSPADTGSG